MLEIARAVRDKGIDVSVSSDRLSDEYIQSLEKDGFICYGNGWFPERLGKDIRAVVLGAAVTEDNPELARAKELGLLIQSIPEFIYSQAKTKIRIVVVGSQGKDSILSMIVAALRMRRMAFDYAIIGEVPLLEGKVHMSYGARIALIEGDEHMTSLFEKRSLLEFYRPHIAVVTNMKWVLITDHDTKEAYMNKYRCFSTSIEREGKLIYYAEDPVISQLVERIREDITAIPFDNHEMVEHDGQTFLKTRYGEYPFKSSDPYFLINVNAARMVCRQLGVKDSDFYTAVSQMSNS